MTAPQSAVELTMAFNLLPEEQLIIDCLGKYGCLKREQLIQMIYYKPRELAEKIIMGLTKRQMLIVDESGNVKHDPRCDYDYPCEIAFWVLLKYIKMIRPTDHYKANYPSQIYFLKERNQYEIIVLKDGEDYLLGPLANTERDSGDTEDESDEMRYIIAVPTESMIPCCKNRMKNFKTLFVVYDTNAAPGIEPNLKFVQ